MQSSIFGAFGKLGGSSTPTSQSSSRRQTAPVTAHSSESVSAEPSPQHGSTRRAEKLLETLYPPNGKPVDVNSLRQISWLGVPPECGPEVRAAVWRNLCGLPPLCPSLESQKRERRKRSRDYALLVQEHYSPVAPYATKLGNFSLDTLILDVKNDYISSDETEQQNVSTPSKSSGFETNHLVTPSEPLPDDPKGPTVSSACWQSVAVSDGMNLFGTPPSANSDVRYSNHSHLLSMKEQSDFKVLRQVRADCLRTCPQGTEVLFKNGRVQLIMTRILYICAALHPAAGYVQGMNDLLVPYFFVFLHAAMKCSTYSCTIDDVKQLSDELLFECEADCFWCLGDLISEIQDFFTPGQSGIIAVVQMVEELVKRLDVKLHNHLTESNISLFQVIFRWVNCLLSREFSTVCNLRLWDTYLSEGLSNLSDLHAYLCATLVMQSSKELREMDFTKIILYFQTMPSLKWGLEEMDRVLAQAFILKSLFRSSPNQLKQTN